MIFDCIDLKNNNNMISDEHCRIQENTVLRAVDILKESPGVILGDEGVNFYAKQIFLRISISMLVYTHTKEQVS